MEGGINMEKYQERVIKEKEELDLKLLKLLTFILSQNFTKVLPSIEKIFLERQCSLMLEYSKVLRDRIALWKGGIK